MLLSHFFCTDLAQVLRDSWFPSYSNSTSPLLKPAEIKNKSICSSSSSQLSGQICQIVFVTLTVLAVCICHCAAVWFLADIMRLSVIMCTGWTGACYKPRSLSLAEPSFPPYRQEDEVSAKAPLRGLLWSSQMIVFVLLAPVIKTLDKPLPLAV